MLINKMKTKQYVNSISSHSFFVPQKFFFCETWISYLIMQRLNPNSRVKSLAIEPIFGIHNNTNLFFAFVWNKQPPPKRQSESQQKI